MDKELIIQSLNSFISAAGTNTRQEPGDYIDAAGILHCGKCGGPKTHIFNIGGTQKILPCICPCEAAAGAEELAKANAAAAVAGLRRLAFPSADSPQHAMTFANDTKKTKAVEIAKAYIANWPEFKALNKGLLFWGKNSTGKTFAAACIVNALIEQGVPACITDFGRLLNEIDGRWDGKQDYIDKLNRFSLLAIDDLGAERSDARARAIIFNVINSRVLSGKPLIITTNLSIQEMTAPENIDTARIYERLLGACHPVEIKGPSLRREALKNDFNKINKILGI